MLLSPLAGTGDERLLYGCCAAIVRQMVLMRGRACVGYGLAGEDGVRYVGEEGVSIRLSVALAGEE